MWWIAVILGLACFAGGLVAAQGQRGERPGQRTRILGFVAMGFGAALAFIALVLALAT